MDNLNEAEYEHISTSLELEKLERSVRRPSNQSSLGCGDQLRIRYVRATFSALDRVRDGKSYKTRAVKAIQNGRVVFIMMPNVPPPEQCETDEIGLSRVIQDKSHPPYLLKRCKEALSHRERSPIALKNAKIHHVDEKGIVHFMYWMKARDSPKYLQSFQKCILAYMSDLRFIYTAVSTAGLKYGDASASGPEYLGLNVSLDHAVWFYEHDFDCGDWLLYEMECPRIGSGRAVVHGRIFTRHGKLIAVTSQEGVLRAKIYGPDEPTSVLSSKL